MEANVVDDFLESRELKLLFRWLRAFIHEPSRYGHAVRALFRNVFQIVFR
jgi:hypothetical protein